MRKNKAKKIMLTCGICDANFEKLLKEHKRQINKNPDRLWYCSLSCAGTKNKKSLGKYLGNGTLESFKGRRRLKDEFSQFRYVMRSVKRRVNKGETDLTLEFLRDIWKRQQGICPLTGWSISLPEDSSKPGNNSSIYRASLDRIDSSKGYIKDNVRFIAIIANYCKHSFSDDEVKLFCKAVVENNNLAK